MMADRIVYRWPQMPSSCGIHRVHSLRTPRNPHLKKRALVGQFQVRQLPLPPAFHRRGQRGRTPTMKRRRKRAQESCSEFKVMKDGLIETATSG